MSKKIVIAGVMQDTNIGDAVIADTFTYMIKRGANSEKDCDCGFNDGHKSRGRNLSGLPFESTAGGGGGEENLKLHTWICMGDA